MHGACSRLNADFAVPRHGCRRQAAAFLLPSTAVTGILGGGEDTQAGEALMAKKGKSQEADFIRVQHAVVIQKGSDLRALNDLLSVGWRAVSTASMGTGVLLILEKLGTEDTIEEMREALGYSGLAEAG